MRSKGAIALGIIVLLVGFAGCAGCNTYNSLVAAEERVETAWANVETQYQRRSDLIPNLVSTVRGRPTLSRKRSSRSPKRGHKPPRSTWTWGT